MPNLFSALSLRGRYFANRSRTLLFLGILIAAIVVVVGSHTADAQDYRLPTRWLEVQQLRGDVFYNGSVSRPAQVGDRLSSVGEGLTTGSQSSALLGVDSGIGTVKLAQNSDLRIRSLSVTASGGRVTRVSLLRGQAAFQVRPFSNNTSQLEIQTPSGIAGVRGTEFGLGVNPSGRTAVLTTDGNVAVTAQGQTVEVQGGYSSLIYPGEPPTPPKPTVENLQLDLIKIQRDRLGNVHAEGRIDPINSLFLRDKPVEVARDGSFTVDVSYYQYNRLRFFVRSPLGNEEEHIFAVP